MENENHCDFVKLREMLIRVNMEDLREQTHTRHYELYRRCKLEEMGFKDTDPDSKPFRYAGTQQSAPPGSSLWDVLVHHRNTHWTEISKGEGSGEGRLIARIARHCSTTFSASPRVTDVPDVITASSFYSRGSKGSTTCPSWK